MTQTGTDLKKKDNSHIYLKCKDIEKKKSLVSEGQLEKCDFWVLGEKERIGLSFSFGPTLIKQFCCYLHQKLL